GHSTRGRADGHCDWCAWRVVSCMASQSLASGGSFEGRVSMTWVELSLKEWRRRPLRTAVTTAGVAIATAALFSLLSLQRGYREGLRQELDHLGAHVLLVPKGCPYNAASMALHGASWPCYLREAYLNEVRTVPEVATAAPVFMTTVYDKTPAEVYVGIDSNML